jgi:hypothetical protein
MTAKPGLERRVEDYYASEPPPRAPDRVLLQTLATIDTTPQRRGPFGPWRIPVMDTFAKLAAAAVVAITIALGAFALSRLVPGATPTPISPPTLFTIVVVAQAIEFDVDVLEAPADTPFVIHFRNLDPSEMLHVVDIRDVDGTVLYQSEVIRGGEATDYEYGPMSAGDYVFICSVHPIPSMTGTLRIR